MTARRHLSVVPDPPEVGVWIAASRRLRRPVLADEPYPCLRHRAPVRGCPDCAAASVAEQEAPGA